MSINDIVANGYTTKAAFDNLKQAFPSNHNLLSSSSFGRKQGLELFKMGYEAGKKEGNASELNEV